MTEQTAAAEAQEYTPWLGPITPGQFQAALVRFDLDQFVAAKPVSEGLFAQNTIVASTEGEYVFRGRPLFPWQFPKESFGAALLHQRTRVPVAQPYLLDATEEIFGWPYVLMRRLPGITAYSSSFSEGELVEYYFGDGEADLVRPVASWLDLEKHRDTRLATALGNAYLERRPARRGFAQRYELWMLRDRLQVREHVTRTWKSQPPGAGAPTFRAFAERYVLSSRLFARHGC